MVTLNLSGLWWETDVSDAGVDGCPHLDEGLAKIAAGCPHLAALDLSCCENVTDLGLQKLAADLPADDEPATEGQDE